MAALVTRCAVPLVLVGDVLLGVDEGQVLHEDAMSLSHAKQGRGLHDLHPDKDNTGLVSLLLAPGTELAQRALSCDKQALEGITVRACADEAHSPLSSSQ
jgi:hypothetical protein